MKNNDWVTFARIYNGPANVAVYSQKIGTNFANFQSVYA
jgi:hypothetical protein